MTDIVTDFNATGTLADTKTKLTTILSTWGYTPGSYTTWGDARTDINAVADSSNQVLNEELASSFITNLNWINDTDNVVGKLFALSEKGAWYDPSDSTTVWTNTLGTTPATWGDAVARIDDKSGNGYYAEQATLSLRPILGRHPKGGIRNLLNNSEDAVAIGGTATITVGFTGKGAFSEGFKITDDDAANNERLGQTVSITADEYTISVYISYDSGNPPSTDVTTISVQGTGAIGLNVNWDGSGGITSVAINGAQTDTVGFDDLGGGLFRVWAKGTYTLAATNSFFLWPAGFIGGGTSTGSIFFYGAQIEQASAYTDYQKRVDQYDITEAGVRSVSYLYFDGVDDYIVSNVAVNLSASTSATLALSAEKLDDTNAFVAASHGGITDGSLEIYNGAGLSQWSFRTYESSSAVAISQLGKAAPDSASLIAEVDRTNNLTALYYDNVLSDDDTTTLSGNCLSAVFAMGARASGASPFKGRIYSCILTQDLLDTTEQQHINGYNEFTRGA